MNQKTESESALSPPDPELVEALSSAFQEALGKAMADFQQPVDPELRLYKPDQAAELLGVTKHWVDERVKTRRIPCTFVGRFPRFTAAHIRAIAAEREVDPATYGRE